MLSAPTSWWYDGRVRTWRQVLFIRLRAVLEAKGYEPEAVDICMAGAKDDATDALEVAVNKAEAPPEPYRRRAETQ